MHWVLGPAKVEAVLLCAGDKNDTLEFLARASMVQGYKEIL